MRILLKLFILALVLILASGTKLIPFLTISAQTPANTYNIGNIGSTDSIKIIVTWYNALTGPAIYKK